MKALVCTALSEDLSGVAVLDTWPEPVLAAGTVRVAMRAAAFNHPDLLMTRGGYQFRPELPFVLGMEGCGIVEAVGEGVDPAWLGTRVIVQARCGTMAERIVVPLSAVRPAPPTLTDAQAAALTVTGLTAWVGLVQRAGLKPGEHVLVTGAGSGVGLAAIQVAKALGAMVTAVASTHAKVAVAQQCGADHVQVVDRDDSASEKSVFHVDQAFDVIFDPIGGHWPAAVLPHLTFGARYLIVGFVAGIPVLPLDCNILQSVSFLGVRAGEQGRRCPADGHSALAGVDALAKKNHVIPYLGLQVRLGDAKSALLEISTGRLIGKAAVIIA
jgi:NADPH2:quinone reductase